MLTVAKMISRVRANCHDEQNIEYTDVLIIDCLNDGVRILRRIAMERNPDVLRVSKAGRFLQEVSEKPGSQLDNIIDGSDDNQMSEVPGKKYELTQQVKFDNPIGQIIRVMIDGKLIKGISASEIEDYEVTGRPAYYYIEGFDTLHFYPAPDRDYGYEIVYVDDMSLLDENSISPFPLVLDDLLVDFCSARISINNEFDVSQEQTVIANYTAQIQKTIDKMVPQCIQVSGYWDGIGCRRRGRW